MRLLITRPREDAEPLAARLAEAGIDTLIEPLLEIVFLDENLGEAAEVQALLATSANGARAAGRLAAEAWFDLPLYAVGDATARAAGESGFRNVKSADGDVRALAQVVADNAETDGGRLLHVAGTRLAGDLQGDLAARGFAVERRVLYSARLSEALSAGAVAAFRQGALDGALFFSPRTARAFATLATDAGVDSDCAKATAYCLSPAVASAFEDAGLAWARVEVAAEPRQDSLLVLLGIQP